MGQKTLDEDELEEALEQLTDEDRQVRKQALRQISHMGPAALPYVMEQVDDPQPRMREMAATLLGGVWWDHEKEEEGVPCLLPAGFPVLVRLLKDDRSAAVRAASARGLGNLAARWTLPALLRAAGDASWVVREAVAHALGRFVTFGWKEEEGRAGRASLVAALLRLMDDSHAYVREAAACSLDDEDHDTPEVHARLWQAMDDPDSEVRGAAALSLARLGDPFLMGRLERLLEDTSTRTPYYIEAASALGDPILLPAVRAAGERWRERRQRDALLDCMITMSIEQLEEAADPSHGEDEGF